MSKAVTLKASDFFIVMDNFNHWKNNSMVDIEGEYWLPVPGYDGTLASNLGRIKTLERLVRTGPNNKGKRLIAANISHQVKSKDGYLRTQAVLHGVLKKVTAHRMCALAFKENPLHKKTVQHNNHIKHCNEEWNLMWFTQSEQLKHTYDSKRRFSRVQDFVKRGKEHYAFGKISPFAKSVNQYDLNGTFIKTWVSITTARKELGINNITSCLNKRQKTAGGFMWEVTT